MNAAVNAGANILPMLGYGQLQFHSASFKMWLIFRSLCVARPLDYSWM